MLTVYLHPLASFCWKVLIGLYEAGTPFTPVTVDFQDPGSAAAHIDRWPVGKIPVLHDAARDVTLPETTIILEYLDHHYPGRSPLIPANDALDVRLWDRFLDQYVHQPMQKIVLDRLRPEGAADPHGVAEARQTLDTAYAMIDARMADRTFAVGDGFTLADCAAVPALFYALIVHPAPASLTHLHAYADRLFARPSVVRILAEARPFFRFFPYHAAMSARFRDGTG